MIRVEADWRESQRRIGEEKQRQDRLRGLQEEAVRSGKQNATVEMRWAELLEQNMPQVSQWCREYTRSTHVVHT